MRGAATAANRGLAAADGASLISLDVWTETEAVVALAARTGEERCRAEPEAAAELVRGGGALSSDLAAVVAVALDHSRQPLLGGVIQGHAPLADGCSTTVAVKVLVALPIRNLLFRGIGVLVPISAVPTRAL